MKTFTVPPSLAAKLSAIAVHVDEHASPDGHPADLHAARTAASDPEVQEWVKSLGTLAPLRRKARP